jgi:hypothetical protein
MMSFNNLTFLYRKRVRRISSSIAFSHLESRARISDSMMGHYVSEETRDRMSAAATQNSPYFRKFARMIDALKTDPNAMKKAEAWAETEYARMEAKDSTKRLVKSNRDLAQEVPGEAKVHAHLQLIDLRDLKQEK